MREIEKPQIIPNNNPNLYIASLAKSKEEVWLEPIIAWEVKANYREHEGTETETEFWFGATPITIGGGGKDNLSKSIIYDRAIECWWAPEVESGETRESLVDYLRNQEGLIAISTQSFVSFD